VSELVNLRPAFKSELIMENLKRKNKVLLAIEILIYLSIAILVAFLITN